MDRGFRGENREYGEGKRWRAERVRVFKFGGGVVDGRFLMPLRSNQERPNCHQECLDSHQECFLICHQELMDNLIEQRRDGIR